MRNNKGSFIAVARGFSIIFLGIILFLILNTVLEGPNDKGGLFDVWEDDLGIMDTAGNATYQTIKVVWSVVPLCLIIAGILYIIIHTQREEPLPGYQTGFV
jgi:uncharacterized membrane protein